MRLPVWAVFGAAVAGCSLIIPLDYVGGSGTSGAGSGGTGHAGGFSGGSGGTPMGGTSNGAEAGAGEGGNGEGGSVTDGGRGGSSARGGSGTGGRGGSTSGASGTDMGGTSMGAVGGSSPGGEDSGGAPEGGAGNGAGGTGGAGSGGAGSGGAGRGGAGSGGAGRGGMGGTAGCSFDLTSNPLHCGSCMTACPAGDECIDSKCVSSPCDELGCGSVLMPDNNGDGPRKDSVGTTNDICVEVKNYTPNSGYRPAINCWNINGRTIEVNKVAVTCGGDKELDMPRRKGGYCFHALPGETANAGFVMPNAASGCCH